MAVRLIVDSASDILPQQATALGMMHLPMTIIFGEDEYLDSVTLSHEEFYEKLTQTSIVPKTCQIPPAVYMETFEEVVQAGDTAVVVTMSSKLSGTYNSACMAAEEFGDKIAVVDSENITFGEQILIKRGLELRDQGLSAQEIKEVLDREKKHIRLYALVDTLEYLRKSGRVSAAAAFAGGLLAIKPVISMEGGEAQIVGKARGSKQGNAILAGLIEKGNGIDFTRPICFGYASVGKATMEAFMSEQSALWQAYDGELPFTSIGSTIGTHAGPGVFGLAFFENE